MAMKLDFSIHSQLNRLNGTPKWNVFFYLTEIFHTECGSETSESELGSVQAEKFSPRHRDRLLPTTRSLLYFIPHFPACVVLPARHLLV